MPQHNHKRTVHIIGAGLAGLAAAIAADARGFHVELYESSGQCGGRCRSYHDAQLDCELDNGNHLVLGANTHVFRYMRIIGATEALVALEKTYPFIDVALQRSWALRPPFYVGDAPLRKVWMLLQLLCSRKQQTIGELVDAQHTAYYEWLTPLVESALNTPVANASASMFRALLMRSLLRGPKAMRPYVPTHSLSHSFVAPAIAYLEKSGHSIHLRRTIKHISVDDNRAAVLHTTEGNIAVSDADQVILATPPWVAQELMPSLNAPTEHHAILNVHFRIAHTLPTPTMIGIVGGVSQWLFTRKNIIASTTSAADHLLKKNKDELARTIWTEAQKAFNLSDEMPPYRVVWEKRATFACTPEQLEKRPTTRTQYANLFLAGDYTDTGLPATIEGTIQSGFAAAACL